MLNPSIYGQAFTNAVNNYSSAHANSDNSRAVKELSFMGKLLAYMGQRGYIVKQDETQVNRVFIFVHRGF